MREQIVAKRYAEAFLSYTKASIGLASAVGELEKIKLILFENPDFQEFLESLEIVYSEKCQAIDKILKDFSEETRTFVKVLLERDRIKNIIGICDYVRINYSHGEAVDALLKTSYPLDLELIEKIKTKLENRLKLKLNLHIELDADLLGGIQVTVGNTFIDGSVRRRLEDLKEQLESIRLN